MYPGLYGAARLIRGSNRSELNNNTQTYANSIHCTRGLLAFGGLGNALLGRIGDDELAVLVTGIAEEKAGDLAKAVHDALDFEFLGVSVRNSAGYARFPRDAHGIEPLMLAAQSGMGHAKAHPEDRLSGPADRI